MYEEKPELMKSQAKEFDVLWKKGKSVKQIAKILGIGRSTLYKKVRNFEEINGVDKYTYSVRKSVVNTKKEDVESSKKSKKTFEEVSKEAYETMERLKIILETLKNIGG